MPVEIRVPTLGESVVEATVLRWHKQVGQPIMVGDALVELETDKVTVDVPADHGGVLQSIAKAEGETAAVGDVLGMLDDEAASAAPPVAAAPAAEQAAAPAANAAATMAPTAPTPTGPRTASRPSEPAPTASPAPAASGERTRPTPLAQKLAQEHGVDLGQVKAGGPLGRVRVEDVNSFLSSNRQDGGTVTSAPPAQPPTAVTPPATTPARPAAVSAFSALGEREERLPMTRRRRTIAQRLVEAGATAAMLTTFNECDLSRIMDMRKRRRDSFRERHSVNLGFMSFFTRAAVGALKAFPRVNAEIRGDDLILKRHYDIGIAVDTEEGLVVPVVRDADRMNFVQIERSIADLAKRAREGKLSIADLQGGTFTITNGGIFGSLFSTPILNMPQAAILGMHRIQERPVVVDGQIVARPMMYLALTYDHRIVDGREAVQFLARIRELVEDPEALLIEA